MVFTVGQLSFIHAIEPSVEALSATHTSASSDDCATTFGRYCRNIFSPFQFNITTAIRFSIMLLSYNLAFQCRLIVIEIQEFNLYNLIVIFLASLGCR